MTTAYIPKTKSAEIMCKSCGLKELPSVELSDPQEQLYRRVAKKQFTTGESMWEYEAVFTPPASETMRLINRVELQALLDERDKLKFENETMLKAHQRSITGLTERNKELWNGLQECGKENEKLREQLAQARENAVVWRKADAKEVRQYYVINRKIHLFYDGFKATIPFPIKEPVTEGGECATEHKPCSHHKKYMWQPRAEQNVYGWTRCEACNYWCPNDELFSDIAEQPTPSVHDSAECVHVPMPIISFGELEMIPNGHQRCYKCGVLYHTPTTRKEGK
jgi:hypothetical protein